MTNTKFYGMTAYQLFLRAFTAEGTFNAAQKRLPMLKELGVDIIYLCPFFEADEDTDEKYLSPRQMESGLGNPKNPYRIKNYFKVDREYGTESDAADFVKAAHDLGMKVIFDLVYFHCGPTAIHMKNNPDYVYRNPDGSILYGEWRFPRLNFKNERLREYLYSNMIYLVTAFDVDGFRCDVGNGIPAGFWREGIARCRKIKEDFFMLNEGSGLQYIEAGFDLDYGAGWKLFSVLRNGADNIEQLRGCPENINGTASICYVENHDVANDDYHNRVDTNPDKGEAFLVAAAFVKGLFLLYNGNEIADCNRHSIYYNRFCKGDSLTIDWSKAETDVGQRRFELVKRLIKIRHESDAVHGENTFDYDGGKLFVYTRKRGNAGMRVFVNVSADDVEIPKNLITPFKNVLLSKGACDNKLSGYGYIVAE